MARLANPDQAPGKSGKRLQRGMNMFGRRRTSRPGVRLNSGGELSGNLAESAINGPEASPRRFGHYEILTLPDGSLHLLGHGSMGITFKAIDLNLRIPVALKILNLQLFQEGLARRRFFREARSAASVRHPNV